MLKATATILNYQTKRMQYSFWERIHGLKDIASYSVSKNAYELVNERSLNLSTVVAYWLLTGSFYVVSKFFKTK